MRLQEKIEAIILNAVNNLGGTPFEVMPGVLALPEDLNVEEIASDPASLRLAIRSNVTPEEGYTERGYGTKIRPFKWYVNFSFRERGVRTSVLLPWGNQPGSTDLVAIPHVRNRHSTISLTATEMGEAMASLRRGYTLRDPDKTTHCVVVAERRESTCDSTGEVGNFGRPIATINTLLKGFGLPLMDTITGNQMLSLISGAARDERVVVSWLDGDISDVYSEESSRCQTFVSCMKGGDKDWFEIYDYLQSRGGLRMLLVHKGEDMDEGHHIGRALVWCGENPSDLYLDRIYAPVASSSSDPRPDIVAAINAFCQAEGIRKTVFEQTERLIPSLQKTGLRVSCPNHFTHYPYVDSLRYLYEDGWLSTSSDRSYNRATLDRTDGTVEDAEDDEDDQIECACGGWYHAEDTRYSDARGETYYYDDVTWVETSNSYIPDDDVVSINGTQYDSERDDVIELHDGDWALEHDAFEIRNYGEYALSEDVVELPDGTYELRDYALENKDGTWSSTR